MRFNSVALNTAGDKKERTVKNWDLTDLQESNKFLFKTVRLTQTIILNALYAIIGARRLVTGKNAFNEVDKSIHQKINVTDTIFDFNRYPNLQELYYKILALLRKLLSPQVTKLRKKHP